MKNSILVTGGAGFIGSHLVDYLIEKNFHVVVLDKLTYAGDLSNLSKAQESGQLLFVKGDICDTELVIQVLKSNEIINIFHLAAESHVDNSISDPDVFAITNVLGTISMLKAATAYWTQTDQMENARFVHVSTDEVFGHLTDNDPPFHEKTPYKPNSPYSASKASSDHFAHAWHSTFGLPVIIANCSNNFGPRQHDEKLIPTIIRNALNEQPIPIYGTGKNIRDWLYVEDHCQGLYKALRIGKLGESYAFGGENEIRNIEIAEMVCRLLDREIPRSSGKPYEELIRFVEDRKGHDWRYAMAIDKVRKEIDFVPTKEYDNKLLETIRYYLLKYGDDEEQNTQHNVDLKTSQSIDFANVDLNYEAFRDLAQNKHLSQNERIGFPDNYRQGFVEHIVTDITQKLNLEDKPNSSFLDIGCGAGDLTSALLNICSSQDIKAVLVDSPEMLQHISETPIHSQVPGKFPDNFTAVIGEAKGGYHSILCYSVLHYIIIDHSIFDFIDAICLSLAQGGSALIGDIPNQSKRNRFFSQETGINYHKKFMQTNEPPIVEHYNIDRNTIDESVLDALIDRARANGCHGYLVPQLSTLPMHNRRDDLLIQKV